MRAMLIQPRALRWHLTGACMQALGEGQISRTLKAPVPGEQHCKARKKFGIAILTPEAGIGGMCAHSSISNCLLPRLAGMPSKRRPRNDIATSADNSNRARGSQCLSCT
jgi:hypothetical protein